jgi:broad specificity phosphatase PhoE
MEGWLVACAAKASHGVAVTHAAVIRAVILVVLGADQEAFWRLDIGPLTATELRHDGRRWVLRSSGCALRAGGPPSKIR